MSTSFSQSFFALQFGALISSRSFLTAAVFAAPTLLHAETTAAFSSSATTGPALLRVFGALTLVLGLFFAGLWLWRNWQRFAAVPGRKPKLTVVEAKSLGPRHTLYVVGYEEQRMLIAASATGVSMLTNLPAAQPEPAVAASELPATRTRLPFAAMLRQAVSHS